MYQSSSLIWMIWVLVAPRGSLSQLTSTLRSQSNESVSTPNLTSSASRSTSTGSSSATVTSFSSTSGNSSCPPCKIGALAEGLNQIVWYNQSISITLDTVSVHVTTYNGTNQTAVTSRTTVYGDLATVNASTISAAQAVSSFLVGAVIQYEGGGPVYLARGSDGTVDGSIGSITSIPWPTPFIKISTADYWFTTSYTSDITCPPGLLPSSVAYPDYRSECICPMTKFWPFGFEPEGLTSTTVALASDFYYPLSPGSFDWADIAGGGMNEFAVLDIQYFSSWLVVQPWATALFPNLRECAFNNLDLQGPPGVKIPVSALTATETITVPGYMQAAPTPAKPAGIAGDASPKSTSSAKAAAKPTPNPKSTSGENTSDNDGARTGDVDDGDDDVNNGDEGHSGGDNSNVGNSDGEEGDGNNGGVGDSNGETDEVGNGYSANGDVGNGEGDNGDSNNGDVDGGDVDNNGADDSDADNGDGDSGNVDSGNVGNSNTDNGDTDSGGVNSGDMDNNDVGNGDVDSSDVGNDEEDSGDGNNDGSPATTPATDRQGTTAAAVVVAGHTVNLPASSSKTAKVVIGGNTLSLNGPAATIDGQTVSVGSGGLVVDSSTHSFATPTGQAVPIATVNGQVISKLPGGGPIIVAGSTISQGVSGVSIGGIPVSLNPSALIYGSRTVALKPSGSSNVITVAGQIITPGPSGVVISGQTITPGGPAVTISGTPISLAASNIVIGTSTIPLPTPSPLNTPQTFVVAGQIFTSNTGDIIISGQTLQQGGPAATVSGTVVSLGASGLVVGTSTYPLPTPLQSSSTLEINGQVFTISPTGAIIAGTTITPGAPALTISGTRISLGTSELVVGSSTYALSTTFSTTSLHSTVLTFGGETYTVASNEVQVAGTVLTEGQDATISGTEISLGSAGLVIGSQTLPLTAATPGLGGVIISAFGPHGTPSATGTSHQGNGTGSTEVAFTGSARKMTNVNRICGALAVVMSVFVWIRM